MSTDRIVGLSILISLVLLIMIVRARNKYRCPKCKRVSLRYFIEPDGHKYYHDDPDIIHIKCRKCGYRKTVYEIKHHIPLSL